MRLYNVVLTENSDLNVQDWQTTAVPNADLVIGAAELGRAKIYIANGIAARDPRAARAHAVEIWAEEGIRPES